MEIVFLKGLEKFREIRKIEDLMKFKNENLKLIINRRTPMLVFVGVPKIIFLLLSLL